MKLPSHDYLKDNSSFYWHLREYYTRFMIGLSRFGTKPKSSRRPRILFYHVSGLSFGGTETFLQLVAKYLPKDRYDTYFMYADQQIAATGTTDVTSRLRSILDGGVFPLRFDYKSIERHLPYIIHGMTPDIFEVLPALDIDLVVSAGSGHAEFPFSGIHNIPIILINIFGQPNVQKNITHHVCISHEVAKKISPFVPAEKIRVMYIPSEPMPEEALRWGKELRHSFQIPDNALVLGRVGRASDDIFDPIGIRAFQSLVDRYQDVHYLIVAPPPALREIVEKERIPRVHFHPGSGLPKDMWSFYGAMDVLAHFRRDGESFGLNIAQAMLAGRPILSHRSSIWNAHAEYLKPDFSRIADVNDEKGYAKNIEWIVGQWREGALPTIGLKARQAAENLVLIDRHIDEFETYIIEALRKKF